MKTFEYGALITANSKLNDVMKTATNVATSKATVLITGESGTGKELLAKYIHEKSPRNDQRFVAVNCAALPEGLLESELFGYEKGAFTGANSFKVGKVEMASGSTFLLDEVSELPLTLQAKLLRVLQEEEVDRLGGKNSIKVNLRIVATTNRDLRTMVRNQTFREDLFYRLNVIPLNLPPLRERVEDVGLLARHFVQVSAILNQRSEKRLSLSSLEKLQAWHWPGNVRELENVIERAVLITVGEEIQPQHIFIDSEGAQNQEGLFVSAGVTLAEMEKRLILKTLESTQQNRTQAARILGISIRTLRNKLHEYKEVHSG